MCNLNESNSNDILKCLTSLLWKVRKKAEKSCMIVYLNKIAKITLK